MASKAALLLALGIALMLHSAVSMNHFRDFERDAQDVLSTPTDIVIECFLGLAVALFAALHMSGELRQIRAAPDLAAKTVDALHARPDFASFNHRGRAVWRKQARLA